METLLSKVYQTCTNNFKNVTFNIYIVNFNENSFHLPSKKCCQSFKICWSRNVMERDLTFQASDLPFTQFIKLGEDQVFLRKARNVIYTRRIWFKI